MEKCLILLDKNDFGALKNSAGYRPGLGTPSKTDGASLGPLCCLSDTNFGQVIQTFAQQKQAATPAQT